MEKSVIQSVPVTPTHEVCAGATYPLSGAAVAACAGWSDSCHSSLLFLARPFSCAGSMMGEASEL